MTLKAIPPDMAPAAIGPYSQAIETGGMLFVSGQLGMSPETGELVGLDLSTQARQCLENLPSSLHSQARPVLEPKATNGREV